MTHEQIKNWIAKQIEKNPNLAKEYKKQKLARLNMELKNNEKAFNREGYMSYRNPGFSRSIIENRGEIEEIESKTAEELLIDHFVEKYGSTRTEEKLIEYIESLDDEDHYIEGVFQDTQFNIRCQEDLEHREAIKDRHIDEIRKIYKNGLSKREQFIESGEKSHQKYLAEQKDYVKKYSDIEKRGPEVIQELMDEEVKWEKFFCRSLAQMSVVDAFDQIGSHPNPKQAEQIDKIIEMHDPSVVESAIQTMIEYPTKNMLALKRNVSDAPVQSQEQLKNMKGLDVLVMVAGGIFTAVGIVGAAIGNFAFLGLLSAGLAEVGLGISGMMRHKRKTNNLDDKEVLMSGCIQDLLDEVVLQETFEKGFGK